MKKGFIALAILTLLTLMTGTAFSADVAKIGVISFETVLKQSSAGKVMQSELKAHWNKLKEKLETEKKRIDEMALAFEREKLVLSPEKQRNREREIRDQYGDLKKTSADYTADMRIMEAKRVNQMQKEVFKIVNELGKKEGYLMILERKIGGVIYAPDHVDITESVINAYNKSFSKK
ncbi:MAG TPA: hypothetical protein DHV36_18895 [Desulfobacteraceae bacterium]|nr:hypothetical protein [Desulfobacteraceae bacterium]